MLWEDTSVLKVVGSNLYILDGHFEHIFVVKIVMSEKTEINKKEAVDCPLKT